MTKSQKFKDRALLIMKYDPSKTLVENRFIGEQGNMTGTAGVGMDTPFMGEKGGETGAEEKEIVYPEYCSYPERAVLPGKNEVGVSGLEAIPERYCCYVSPKQLSRNGGESSIFLPYDSEITFWNEINFDFFLNKHMEKNKYPKEWLNGLTSYYLKMKISYKFCLE